jgi:kumamolisin
MPVRRDRDHDDDDEADDERDVARLDRHDLLPFRSCSSGSIFGRRAAGSSRDVAFFRSRCHTTHLSLHPEVKVARMAQERVAVPGSERSEPPGAAVVGDAAPDETVTVTVIVRPRKALPPVTETGEKPLSRAEFAQRYGAAPEDLSAVERFASDAGLTVVASDPARRSVQLAGSVAAMSMAFETSLKLYEQAGTQFRGRTGGLTVPAALAGIVRGVHGLDNRAQAETHFRMMPAAAAATSFTALQIAELYAFPTTATGKGQTIALIELGGGYKQTDLDTYFTGLGITTPPTVISVGVDGATNAPVGNADSADGEVMLDIEIAGALAPAATIVVYFAPNTDQGFLDAITTAIHDTTNHPTIVSISWGGAESTWTAQSMTNYDDALAEAGALGVTVTVAAGDSGSSDGVTDKLAHVDFPASSPHVVACGGTSVKASGTTITSETVWNDGTSGGATGGGISDVFALPSWQSAAKVPPSANAGGHVGRGVPDVAGDADPNTGWSVVVDGAQAVFGGTSAVAPLWAGLIARLNEGRATPLGFVNPALYAAPSALHDITKGSNGAYKAAKGWDACTGLGSPNGSALETALG